MKKALLIVGIVILLIASLLAYGIYWAFYDIQHLDGQDVIEEVSSDLAQSDNDKTLKELKSWIEKS